MSIDFTSLQRELFIGLLTLNDFQLVKTNVTEKIVKILDLNIDHMLKESTNYFLC